MKKRPDSSSNAEGCQKFNMDGGGGGGDSFDPCECICSHEGAMRRLISLVSKEQYFCI